MPNVTSSPHVTHDVITRSRTQRQPQNNEISLRPRLFLLPVTQVDMNKNYFPSAADWSIERNLEELHSLIHPYQRYLSDIQHNVEENCFSYGWVQIHCSWWYYDVWLTQLCSTNAQLHSCQLERSSSQLLCHHLMAEMEKESCGHQPTHQLHSSHLDISFQLRILFLNMQLMPCEGKFWRNQVFLLPTVLVNMIHFCGMSLQRNDLHIWPKIFCCHDFSLYTFCLIRFVGSLSVFIIYSVSLLSCFFPRDNFAFLQEPHCTMNEIGRLLLSFSYIYLLVSALPVDSFKRRFPPLLCEMFCASNKHQMFDFVGFWNHTIANLIFVTGGGDFCARWKE